MGNWSERASQRLRDNERIEVSVPVGENGVVVTNQRVLAFVPEGDGPNFRSIERPNVEGVSVGSVGDPSHFEWVGKGVLAGIAGVAIGLTVDFETFLSLGQFDTSATGRMGMGGLLQVLNRIQRLLAMLDDVILVVGLLGFTAALGAFGRYLESRTYGLRIDIAGEDEELLVPAPKGSTDEASQLTQVLQPAPSGGD